LKMTRSIPRAAALLAASFGLSACGNMQRQENVHAFTPSKHFADDSSARIPPAHTVSRSDLAPDDPTLTGLQEGHPLEGFPMELTRDFVLRGGNRYGVFCADCHGTEGDGRGIIVARGFPRPASFFDARVKGAPAGAMFRAIGNGSGVMYGFSDRLSPTDRWAIVAYIRALEKSQSATLAEVPEGERLRLTEK
jgi:cytochrome c553